MRCIRLCIQYLITKKRLITSADEYTTLDADQCIELCERNKFVCIAL